MISTKFRHFHDFAKRIPRGEMIQLRDLALGYILRLDPKLIGTVCGSFRRGAVSSGDIDILMGHSDYTSECKGKKQEYVKRVVAAMEEGGFVTDTLSLGETKFMVSHTPHAGHCVSIPTYVPYS